jgi:UDP-N-acetylmuramoyl-tripeptide--D-alanyl-D-alanine ligase
MNLNVQNKIIVLGDMFELGSYAFEEHYTIIEKLIHYINNNNSSAEVHIVGHNFYEIHKTHFTDSKIKSYKTTDELIKSIQNKTFQNTWILIKGSRGMKMETIIEYFY